MEITYCGCEVDKRMITKLAGFIINETQLSNSESLLLGALSGPLSLLFFIPAPDSLTNKENVAF